MDKNKLEILIGNVYERNDSRLAFVYRFDPITNTYMAIVQGSGDIYAVNEDGKYHGFYSSHNDLVKFVK